MTSNIVIAKDLGKAIYQDAGWNEMDACEIIFYKNKIHIYNLDLELRKREIAREQINS